MKDNWFEDKMNERFEDFDSELDLHAAWADLEERRQPKKRKKRAGIFWWIGSGLAILLVTIGLVFNSTEQTQLSSVDEVSTSHKNKAKDSSKTQQQLSDNQANTKKIEQAKSKQTDFKIDENHNRKKSLEKENHTTEKSINLSKESMINNSSQNLPILSLENNNSENKSSLEEDSAVRESDPALVLIEALEKNISPLPNKVIHHTIECGFEGNQRNLRTFGITFNYGKAFRSSPTARGINSPYMQRRNMAETPLDSWSTQLFYQLNNKKNWFTRVNIGYNQTTDLFQDSYTNYSKVLKDDQIVQINMYPNGLTEEITGSTIVDTEKISTGKFYQRYRQAFIGLEFGKEKYLPSNFKLRAALGGDISLYHANSGNVYLNDDSSSRTYQNLSKISTTKGGILAARLSLEIGKSFGFNNEISFGIVGKANLKILENDLGKRQYLLSSFSYRKSF